MCIAAIFRHPSFDVVFRRAVWNEPITKDADGCLFHVTFMEISHKFKSHASGLWLVDFDPSCLLSMSKDGCRKIAAMHVALDAGIKRVIPINIYRENKKQWREFSHDW